MGADTHETLLTRKTTRDPAAARITLVESSVNRFGDTPGV